jgi:outer membrane protein assembly factor BamB
MHSIFLLLAATAVGTDPDCWPGFLGAGAGPIDPQSVPFNWSPTENIAWKTALPGRGQSSPVIWDQRVFVTSIDGPMKDTSCVLSLALDGGRILWKHTFTASQKVRSNYFQSRAAPTPVVDGSGVFAFFETGDVVALTHDGKERWRRSLTKDYGEFESTIGLAASPIQTADSIILLIDHEGPSYLLALDKSTGKTLWKTERASRKSYATPALVPVDRSTHVVCSSAGSIDGYDPDSGKLLWTHGDVGGNTSATPLAFAEGRFLVGASPGMHNEREKAARQSNFAMTIEATADGFSPKILWQTTEAMPTFASPVVYRNCAYWINRVGVVHCFDATTGKPLYTERTKQSCWAAPLGFGDRVYLFGKDGMTTVLAAGPEFRILAENQLWEPDETEPEDSGSTSAGTAERKPNQIEPNPAEEANRSLSRSGEGSSLDGHADGGRPQSGPRGLTFSDPVQYGVAVVNGRMLIRTGSVVYCIREKP